MNHRALARAFQRIVASSMTVSGGALLVSCGGATNGSSGGRNDRVDGSGPDRTTAPAQGDADTQDATVVGWDTGDVPKGDASTADGYAASDDAQWVYPDSLDASVDARGDTTGDIADSSIDAGSGDADSLVLVTNGDATFVVTGCGTTVPFRSSSLCRYPVCVPIAAPVALLAFNAGSLSGARCDPYCGTGGPWVSCTPVDNGGGSFIECDPGCVPTCGASYADCHDECFPIPEGGFVLPGGSMCSVVDEGGVSLIRCNPSCGFAMVGRRPAGLLPSPRGRGAALGAHFAEMARLEAASVDAFHHMRRELIAHRAPRRLVKAAERAARDEIRHARMTRALAKRYGGGVVAPRVEPRPVRSLEAIAVENAVEGCVREAFGALVAHWQAVAAMDPVIRASMARIARDETRHAALAFEVDAWLRGRLGRAAQARVATVRDRALEELASDEPETPATLRSKIGLPTRGQSRLLLEQLAANRGVTRRAPALADSQTT